MSDKIDAALQNLLAALRLAPNNPECYLNLAKFYYFQGQTDTAIPLLEKAVRIDPAAWEAHYVLGNSFSRKNMMNQAAQQYNAALKINPHHANTKLNLALALVSLNEYAAALPYLTEAAILDPRNAELQAHLADALLNSGKTAAAIKQFAIAVALDPTRAAWHYNLAVLYMRNEQNDLAVQSFKNVLQLDPNNSTARHLLTALTPADQHATAHPSAAPSTYVSELFDQYSAYYNVHMREKLKYNVPVLLRQEVAKVLGVHKPPQNILDLGCGTGLCGIYFRDMANFLIGADLSYGMLQEAKNLGAYDGLCQCNILEAIPGFGRAVFDIVLAADVLVYLGDLHTLFATVKGVLRAEGMFAFTIETSQANADFELLPTGRFAHNPLYIETLATQLGFAITTANAIVLRESQQQPVGGMLYLLVI